MNKRRVDLALLIIYAIFLYPVVPGRFSMACYLALYGIPLCYVFFHAPELNCLLGRLGILPSMLVLGLGFLLVASMSVPVLAGTHDFSYVNVIMAIARKLLIVSFLMLVTSSRCPGQDSARLFMRYYVLATCCYVASTCVFLAFPSLKETWIRFIGTSEYYDHLYSSYGYGARFGWSGFSGYRTTLDCSISIVFAMALSTSGDSSSNVGDFELSVGLFTCFVGNLFYGRTGVIASAICIVIGLVFYRRVRIGQLLGLVLLAVGGYYAISVIKDNVSVVREWYDWATKPFVNLFNTGSFDNYSVNHILNDMIYMPEVDTLLHGDGWYTEPVTNLHYMHTDVGFMRQVLFWGAPLTLFAYLATAGSILLLREFDRVMPLLFVVIFAVFEFKGEVFYELIPLALVMFLVERSAAGKQAPRKGEPRQSWARMRSQFALGGRKGF